MAASVEGSRLLDAGPQAPGPDAADAARVAEVLRAVGTALRSHRLYGGSGPMHDRFVEVLRQRLGELWESLPLLRLRIEEQGIRWEGQPVQAAGEAAGDLAFLLYRDGIRELVVLPGFEESEILAFLRVLARVPALREEEDDLVTLLWQEDLGRLRYRYVDLAAEPVELGPAGGRPAPVDAATVRSAAAEPDPGFTADDFQETLYFLDEAELRALEEEVRREAERDLWADVLSALLDRLEDGTPERQLRVVRILTGLLPSLLGAGRLGQAAVLLGELVGLARRPGLLDPAALGEIRSVFSQLASEGTVRELVQLLEETRDAEADDSLVRLLGYFPLEALPLLMRAAEGVARPAVRRLLEEAVLRLAGRSPERVVPLLADPDPVVVTAAARLVGRLEIRAAIGRLQAILGAPDPALRAAALEALRDLRAPGAAKAFERLLDDPEREVRIAAARALGDLGHRPSRGALEAALASRRLRAADRTEKIAFFESYGRVAGEDGVPLLTRALNARGWLGRGEAPEIRACAALGLARVAHPSARAALLAAESDPDPVVRTAVSRALREERR
jgi:HEAT repeat protein